jgi:sensor c-di-GMP phosphodiesterase-like protein
MGAGNSIESLKTSIQRSVSTNISSSLQSSYSSIDSHQAVIVDCSDVTKMTLLLQCQKDAREAWMSHQDIGVYESDKLFCTGLQQLAVCGIFDSEVNTALDFNDDGKLFVDAIQDTVSNLQTLAESELKQNNLFQFGNSISEEVKQYQESVQTNMNENIQLAYTFATQDQLIQVTNGEINGLRLSSTMSVIMHKVFGSKTTQSAETALATKMKTILDQTNGGFDVSMIIQLVVGIVAGLLVLILIVYLYRRYVSSSV